MYFLKERRERVEIIKQEDFKKKKKEDFMTFRALVPPAFRNSMEHIYFGLKKDFC